MSFDRSITVFQKTLVITPKKKKKRTVLPGYVFEDTTFKPGFEIIKV